MQIDKDRLEKLILAVLAILVGITASYVFRPREVSDGRPPAHVFRPEDGQGVRLIAPKEWVCAGPNDEFWECRPKTAVEALFREWQQLEQPKHAHEHEHEDHED